jgi:hypothetical protein
MTMTTGWSKLTFKDIFGNDSAIDFLADTFKGAVYTGTLSTPNYDTVTGKGASPFSSNEVVSSSGGYSAGGLAIASPTLTVVSGTLVFDGADLSWSGVTWVNSEGVLVYDDTITTPTADPVICGLAFGTNYPVTAGTFQIQWPAAGILVWN